ncbi:MAG: response regulator [Steroidobacteraceae bacterium]
MMQVVIVDDEPSARRTLRECCAREPDLHIAGEYGDGRSALSAILASPPDLLFLDIQIDSVNGIALARSLDPQTLPDIVFVTAYDRYALEAFEVCASDYLLKPFDYQRFQATGRPGETQTRGCAKRRSTQCTALGRLETGA